MLGIVAPNLLVVNAMMHPIIETHMNLRIKYIEYFGTNPRTTGKFGLSATLIISVLAKFTELDCLQLLPFYSSMMMTTAVTILIALGDD
jgi:hypothetical protein